MDETLIEVGTTMAAKSKSREPRSGKANLPIDIEERVRQRAYQLYQQRRGVDGFALNDWLQAEREIQGAQKQRKPVALLESADRVLPAVKQSDMYATLAMLYFDSSTQAEYTVAGHLPILHYRFRSGDTGRLSMEQPHWG